MTAPTADFVASIERHAAHAWPQGVPVGANVRIDAPSGYFTATWAGEHWLVSPRLGDPL